METPGSAWARAQRQGRCHRESCIWRRVRETLGGERFARVAARFYDKIGGPLSPLVFQPLAAIAIAALSGAEIRLPHRPSVNVPGLPRSEGQEK